MIVIIKDLPTDLDCDKFRGEVIKKFPANRLDFTFRNKIFKRVCYIDLDQKHVQKFIKHYNNSYVSKFKVRCELKKEITFLSVVDKEIFRGLKIEKIENLSGRTSITFKIINLAALFKVIGENGLQAVNLSKNHNLTSLDDEGSKIVKKDKFKTPKDEVVNEQFIAKTKTNSYSKNTKEYFNALFFNFTQLFAHLNVKNDLSFFEKYPAVKISYMESQVVYECFTFFKLHRIFINNLLDEEIKNVLIIKNIVAEKDISDEITDLLNSRYNDTNKEENNKLFKIYCVYDMALLKFTNKNDAQYILGKIDNAVLARKSSRKNIPKSNKYIVKNVPFQATEEELKVLFETKIKLKHIRIPQRNEKSRGFAFIELKDENDSSLLIEFFGINTHFYGRRLVLEPSA